MPYIRYSTPNDKGVVYASLVESIRNGSSVRQKQLSNLGRVIDRDKGIFKSRSRGIYKFTIEEGYAEAPASFTDLEHQTVSQKEKLILDFGDSFVLSNYMRKLPFFSSYFNLFSSKSDRDTLFSLLLYRMLTDKKAYYYAHTWWSGNYASLLYPDARMQSQRVSEFLVNLGEEEIQRKFFDDYLSAIYGISGKAHGILIDSTGVVNSTKMSITQLSNHNGDINMEVRLIYVIDRHNGMPLYFRYCPGNIIDVSTLCTTIAELSQYSIDVNYAIVDAGYFSEENVTELYKNNIHFVTRLAPNRKAFKAEAEKLSQDIFSPENAIRYGNRLVYLKRDESELYGYKAYFYYGIDMDSHNQQFKRTMFNAIEDNLSPEEMKRKTDKLGAFMIISSDNLEASEILPLYYTRQQVEQVFDIGKNNADLVPIRIHNEETFKGHLMLTFMATAILQQLQQEIIKKRKKNDKINPEGAFMILRNQKCKVYENNIVPQEPVKDINDIYKLLKIDLPVSISKSDIL